VLLDTEDFVEIY